MRNDNGYIEANDQYKAISSRHIGVGNEWKDQDFKFVGKDGYWRLVYTGKPISFDEEFYTTHLQGYTLERGNQLDLYGNKFNQTLYPFPKVGGYWELSRNTSDLFENFINGQIIGNTVIGGSFDNLTAFKPANTGDYFQLPTDIDSGLNALGLIGAEGNNDFVLSTWFFPTSGYTNQKLPLFSYGDSGSGLEIYIQGTNLYYKTFSGGNENVQTLGLPSLNAEKWYRIVIVRTQETRNEIYLSSDVDSPPLLDGEVISIATPVVASALEIRVGASIDSTSNILIAYRNVYGVGNRNIDEDTIKRLLYKIRPLVVLKNRDTLAESIIPQEWIVLFNDKKISFTIPPDFPLGHYDVFIRNTSNIESFKFPIEIKSIERQEMPFADDFSDPATLKENYLLLNRAWGGANGGVVSENVSIKNGELVIKANGDKYNGKVIGVDRDGKKKFHNQPGDPRLNEPWKTRVGGCLVFNKKTGFGSYELDMKIPQDLGVCSAMWTFFYNEIYPTDPRYETFLSSNHTELFPNVARFSFNNRTVPQAYNAGKGGASITVNEPGASSRINGVGNFNINSVEDGALRYSGSSLNPFTVNDLPYQITHDSPFTIGFWLKVEPDAYVSGRVNGLFRLGSGANSVGVDLVYAGAGAIPTLRFAWRTATNTVLTNDANFAVNLNQWQHIAMTYDGNNTINCYVDGLLKQTLARPAGTFTPQTAWQLFNRASITGTANTSNRTMAIDELIISQEEFTNGQIQALMDQPDMYKEFHQEGEGLHRQGSFEDGYYVTRNHEIDIEIPSHLDGGILSEPSLANIKCNTWRGEMQNWDVEPGDGQYWEEYRDNLTPAGTNLGDGNYHKLRFDWYHDRVEFYVDNVLLRKNVNTDAGKTIPDIAGHFTFGMWFPSSPKPGQPWLVNKHKAWAGGRIDPVTDSMKADFETVEMRVRSFKFTPFPEELPHLRSLGETYPFGGYRINKNY